MTTIVIKLEGTPAALAIALASDSDNPTPDEIYLHYLITEAIKTIACRLGTNTKTRVVIAESRETHKST